MADKIKVNTSRLGTDAASVKADISKMKTSVKNMKADVTKLNSMWSGVTNNAFKQVFADDINALETIISNLEKIYNYETNAKSKYENCEKKVSSLASSIKI